MARYSVSWKLKGYSMKNHSLYIIFTIFISIISNYCLAYSKSDTMDQCIREYAATSALMKCIIEIDQKLLTPSIENKMKQYLYKLVTGKCDNVDEGLLQLASIGVIDGINDLYKKDKNDAIKYCKKVYDIVEKSGLSMGFDRSFLEEFNKFDNIKNVNSKVTITGIFTNVNNISTFGFGDEQYLLDKKYIGNEWNEFYDKLNSMCVNNACDLNCEVSNGNNKYKGIIRKIYSISINNSAG